MLVAQFSAWKLHDTEELKSSIKFNRDEKELERKK